jgi:molybdenum cofactor biosynthesis enzyme MoaA
MNAYTRLGGRQINVTGGEPLARKDLIELVEAVDKRQTRIVVNSNVLLAERLLCRPVTPAIDGILASLHTTDDRQFADELGGGSATDVMANIVALRRHGYVVDINYSLAPYNLHEFPRVLDFAAANGIGLKTIALVRSAGEVGESDGFYRGDWVDPTAISRILEARGARETGRRESFGGRTTTYDVGGTWVKVKNVARGRLRTSYCDGCTHEASCGEGIYGLRVGVDGLWKPCLLRRDGFTAVDPSRDYTDQVLDRVAAMLGEEGSASFVSGRPS